MYMVDIEWGGWFTQGGCCHRGIAFTINVKIGTTLLICHYLDFGIWYILSLCFRSRTHDPHHRRAPADDVDGIADVEDCPVRVDGSSIGSRTALPAPF